MKLTKKKKKQGYHYLKSLKMSSWSRSGFHFDSKINALTNSPCESFNKWMGEGDYCLYEDHQNKIDAEIAKKEEATK